VPSEHWDWHGRTDCRRRNGERAGIHPETFREALRGSDFSWHKRGDDWTVEIDSPEHEAMRTVLLILLLKKKKKNLP
jgi:hypothetical protein